MTENTLSPIDPYWESLYRMIPGLTLTHGHSRSNQHVARRESMPVYALHQLGLLMVEGLDSNTFLQGQLTVDINALSVGATVFAAHCDAKGRINSNFMLHRRTETQFFLQLPRSNSAIAQQALNKYAVFSKCSVADVSADYCGFGYRHNSDPCTLDTDDSPITLRPNYGDCVVWIPTSTAEDFVSKVSGNTLCHWLGSAEWQARLIELGIGFVENTTSGHFIPQQLNMDALNGISFDKGCYTGQEIIARMKYRGTVKRRCYAFSAQLQNNDALGPDSIIRLIQAGQSLFDNNGNPLGEIVSSAIDANAKLTGLAVVKNQQVTGLANAWLERQDKQISPITVKLEAPPYAINNN